MSTQTLPTQNHEIGTHESWIGIKEERPNYNIYTIDFSLIIATHSHNKELISSSPHFYFTWKKQHDTCDGNLHIKHWIQFFIVNNLLFIIELIQVLRVTLIHMNI